MIAGAYNAVKSGKIWRVVYYGLVGNVCHFIEEYESEEYAKLVARLKNRELFKL